MRLLCRATTKTTGRQCKLTANKAIRGHKSRLKARCSYHQSIVKDRSGAKWSVPRGIKIPVPGGNIHVPSFSHPSGIPDKKHQEKRVQMQVKKEEGHQTQRNTQSGARREEEEEGIKEETKQEEPVNSMDHKPIRLHEIPRSTPNTASDGSSGATLPHDSSSN